MRQEHNNILIGFFQEDNDIKVPKNVQEYRENYKQIDALLQKYPEIQKTVHQDIQTLCQSEPIRKRKADFITENLFRAILVMQLENVFYRKASILIAESKTLQDFCQLTKKETINHHLLCAAFKSISPDTWKTINQQHGE